MLFFVNSNNDDMKRFLFFSAILVCAAFWAASCDENSDVPVTGVTLSKSTVSIVKGTSTTLTATVLPSNASNQAVIWYTTDPSVVTVEDGKVNGVGVGGAYVMVFTAEGAKKAECKVFVTPDFIKVKSVKLDKPSLELVEEETATLTATIEPDNATDQTVTWSSSNTSVATVTDGTVTAVAAGEAKITVTTNNGGFTASCNVTVEPKVIHVTSVTLLEVSAEGYVGQTIDLHAVVSPGDATDKSITWESSAPDIASVEATNETDATVNLLAEGEVTITVKSVDGEHTDTCPITIKPKPGVEFRKISLVKRPDMLEPKSDFSMFWANGELVVAGGHTTGFKISNEAEYYTNDGVWHSVTMNYAHDFPFGLMLSDGKFMIGGGASSDSGVGQIAGVETYDPTTHTFTKINDMTTARLMARAIQLENGNVVVAGNWYGLPYLEIFDASTNNWQYVGAMNINYYMPYVFRTGKNEAIVFNNQAAQTLVYNGYDAYTEYPSILNTWKPIFPGSNLTMPDFLIGDFATDDYTYLIAAENSAGKIGLLKVDGRNFSLVETDNEIPTEYNSEKLTFTGPIIDRNKNIAYLVASNTGSSVFYVFYIIDLSEVKTTGKAQVAVAYYTDPMTDCAPAASASMALSPTGMLAIAGGIYNSNYTPFKSFYTLKIY